MEIPDSVGASIFVPALATTLQREGQDEDQWKARIGPELETVPRKAGVATAGYYAKNANFKYVFRPKSGAADLRSRRIGAG